MWRNALDNFRKFDWILLVAVFLLFCLGLAAIYSVGLSQGDDAVDNFKKQVIFSVIGFCCLFAVGVSNYSGLRVYSRTFYALSLFVLVLVLFLGSSIRGTTGWFLIGGLGIQPAELAKIVLIILLAKFFSNRLQQFRAAKHIIVSLGITLSFVILILLQPDFGSALIFLGVWFILLLITGIPKKYLIILAVVFVIVSLIAWNFLFLDYQRERIKVFLQPTADPLGSGYNVTQSIIAIGSGNWWGRGLGFGSQSQLRFVPESQTDFLFAVIAEELGLFGVSLTLFLWIIIFYRLIAIAKSASDDFGLFLVLGIASLFFLHLFINIGMNMGIMPVTGISLPFLSYGGSFLIICLILVGIAESVAVRRQG
ncbi:rod shape-determining protein RodA [Patescibacteria group bacterium]|nr:rod shape-determining protein RodA [Patescibacteria group bacterium]